MDAATLVLLLLSGNNPRMTLRGETGILQSLEREDGSGRSFNVVIRTDDGRTVKGHMGCQR